ncbi:MAG: hypothetical protein M3O71_19285 [Bacteroidota bacterium]|nr:hypothetical protein [Bacteroidota bacterium]
MKRLLFCTVFTLVTANLRAQYNQFRDDKTYLEKQCKYMAYNKIKQVDEYMLSGSDTTTKNKVPECSLFFDVNGRLSKEIYSSSRTSSGPIPDSPSITYTYSLHGKLISKEDKAFYHQLKTYVYNAKGKLLKEAYTTNIPADNAFGYHDYIITYRYNKTGDIIAQTNFGPGNVLNWKKLFTYNERHTMVECLIQTPGSKAVICDKYRYSYHNNLLTKKICSYKNDTLIFERRFVYDRHHRQISGYEIKDGATKNVWDYTYNQKGQLMRSLGGPATVNGLADRDLRKDGLTPIAYKYSDDGLLAELSKTSYFPNMGKEVTSIEKFVYKRY